MILEISGLDAMEKQLLTNLLRDDAGRANSDSPSDTRLSWRQVGQVFIDWRIYLYVFIGMGNMAIFKCLTLYLPQLSVESLNNSSEEVHLMTIPLYFVACVCCLLAGYLSSRQQEHCFHLATCLLVSLIGFIFMIALFDQGIVPMYISTSIACCGSFSAFPLILSWLTNNVGGRTKRAMAIGLVFIFFSNIIFMLFF